MKVYRRPKHQLCIMPFAGLVGIITMRIIAMMNLKGWIKNHENCKLRLYTDTEEKLTIGWGRNIQDNGISQAEADFMFDNDFARCQKELAQYSWYVDQPQNVKDALMNMNFNLGISRLLGFKKMITALVAKDYTKAAIEALNSKWSQQVGQRAKDVALMIRQG